MTAARQFGLAAAAALAGVAAGALGTGAVAGEAVDRAAIERIVHDYILTHPEILPEAMQRLREREQAQAIGGDRSALLRPFAGAWAGAGQPRVTLVMFTDYACGYCRASAPDIDKLLASTPDLRVVWREIPILGPNSQAAARAALAAAKAGRYLPFHRALFASGRPDARALDGAARAAALDPARVVADARADDIDKELRANLQLAAKLGVSGTPAFVVGDRMLSGAVGYDALKQAVDAARAG